MLPSLLAAAALTAPAAPIPRDNTPNSTGPAPRVIAVKADASGTVWITAQIWEKRKMMQNVLTNENGKQVMKQREVEQTVSNYIHKSLLDFGARFATADGASISTDDALKRVKGGGTLLISADGKPIDRAWLRAVDGDTVVMQVEGLAHAHFQYNLYNPAQSTMPTTAAPRLAMFRADQSGAVKVPVSGYNVNSYGGPAYIDDGFGGARIIRGRAVVWQGNGAVMMGGPEDYEASTPAPDGKKLLSDVKFEAYKKDGALVPKTEALKRLKAGGLVVIAGDSKFPDPAYLKAFHEDILVLVSNEFVFPQGSPNPYDMPVKTDGKKAGNGGDISDGTSNTLDLKAAPALIKGLAAPRIAPAPKPVVKPAEKPAAKPADATTKPAPKRG